MSSLAALPQTSLVLACDMPATDLQRVVRATAQVPKMRAYKIGAALGLELGLRTAVEQIRTLAPDSTVIYDHQKAGTDIPETSQGFMETLSHCGVDAVILFPLSGPATENAWISAARAQDLDVIVGGHMTHAEFLASEGGYIEDKAVERIFTLAREKGVTDFVVPGNQPAAITRIREIVGRENGDIRLFAPGFVDQGGEITEAGKAAGANWHAIVGRAIFNDPDPATAARQMAARL